MSGYKTFAVWGAGNQGTVLVKELLAQPSVSSVTVLTRPESRDKDTNKELAAQGVIITPFDINADDASKLLEGIDVLISTTGGPSIYLQSKLIHAAHKANVKLFVPSEWSSNGDDRDTSIDKLKTSIRVEAQNVGLPTASFFPGGWIDFFHTIGWDFPNGKITIRGTGEQPISMTSTNDTARFAAHALTRFPREKLENKKFHIESERVPLYELAQRLQRESSKPIEIVRTGRKELEDAVAADPNDLYAAFFLAWDLGKGFHRNELSNDLWPEWKPKTAVEVLRPLL